jgi:polysaccharide biosynthesis protein PslH
MSLSMSISSMRKRLAGPWLGRRPPPFAVCPPPSAIDAAALEPDITVLIPAFRHERFVEAALTSVLTQGYRGFRVLVVDDSSPDATAGRAKSMADPRITVRVNERTLGLGSSVAGALADIATPMVALLNSDDLFHPERLERCRAVLLARPAVQLVATGVSLIDEAGGHLTAKNASRFLDGRRIYHWVRWYDGVRAPGNETEESVFFRLLAGNFLLTSSNIVCRTAFLREHSEALTGLRYCLDWQLFLDAALDRTLAYLPDELVAYRLHDENTIWKGLEEKWPYFREVNAVAARTVRKLVSRVMKSGTRGEELEKLLAGLIQHLGDNPEVDGLALYLNEILPADALRSACESSPRVRSLVRQLGSQAERTRVDRSGLQLSREPSSSLRLRGWFTRITSKARRARRISKESRLAAFLRKLSGGTLWRPSWVVGWLYLCGWTVLLQLRRWRRGHSLEAPRGLQVSRQRTGTRRPRVLVVCPYPVYPPDHGGGVRIFNLARRVAGHCDLHLYVFIRADDDPVQRAALEPFSKKVYFHRWAPAFRPGFLGIRPRSEQIFASGEAERRIDEIVAREKIDVLQLEYAEMGQYGLRRRPGLRAILTEHDIGFRSRWRRRAAGFHRRYPADRRLGYTFGDWMRQARYELAVAGRADQVHVMSAADADYLAGYLAGGQRSIRVIPNGVDVDHYRPLKDGEPDRRALLFVGNFGHLPNVDALEYFCGEVWDRVCARVREARLTVVGAGATDEVARHGSREGITVAGAVSDVLPYYQSHGVLVAPIRAGSGTRLKILEAMACGLPVVSSSLGAEGIDCVPGRHILVADTPAAFAEAVGALTQDRALWFRLAAEGRRLVAEKYDWNLSAGALLAAYEELL